MPRRPGGGQPYQAAKAAAANLPAPAPAVTCMPSVSLAQQQYVSLYAKLKKAKNIFFNYSRGLIY